MTETTAPPKLRSDLIVRRYETRSDRWFVVKDPVSGRFFRLREPEQFIAAQLDGVTPLETIGQRLVGRFGVDATPATLQQFVGKLSHLGLLETGDHLPQSIGQRRRIGGTLLYLRLKAFDPNRLFDCLIPVVRFCFTPYFMATSAALLLVAAGITVAQWPEITKAFAHLARPGMLALAWLTVLTVSMAHECAHGLTCKYFGGEVREMGFMLIYFQPALYCNVSDAWLFPERSKRLWVTFAGAYFELILWAVATILWSLATPGTVPSHLALIVMATSGIKTLFNWNPLIKLDGYYMLSDYLEVPNLRQKSFQHISALFGRLWRRSQQPGPDVSPRERRIYLIYGALAGTYSYWLLSIMLVRLERLLIGRYHTVGLILFTALLVMLFRNPLKVLLARVARTQVLP